VAAGVSMAERIKADVRWITSKLSAALLAESLEVIQKASAVILAALEPKPDFEEPERQYEMAAAS
jgi:hypothetical protein